MSKRSHDFVSLLPASETQPPTAYEGPALRPSLLRDQLSTSSWVCLGAVAQGLAFMLIGKYSLLPAVLVVLTRFLDRLAILAKLKHNYFLDGVLMKKFSAQFPDEEGRYGDKPAATDVVLFLIGTRTNHPLGLLAPGTSTMFQYFANMEKDLKTHSDEFGFLGMRTCLDATERSTQLESERHQFHRSQVL